MHDGRLIYGPLVGCKPMNVPRGRDCTVFRADRPDRYPMIREGKNYTSPSVEMRHVAFLSAESLDGSGAFGADITEGNSERYS